MGRIDLAVASSGRYFSQVFAEEAMRCGYSILTLQVECDFCSLDIPVRAIARKTILPQGLCFTKKF